MGSIKLGQKVKISLDSFANKTFEGEVVEIPKFVDATTTNLLVKISVNKNGDNILYGMTGDAEIALEKKENTTALDFDAIFNDESNDNKSYVYILENNEIKKVYIELGLEGDRYTEVLTNLKNKTIVIPQKVSTMLTDGQKAQIVK